MRVRRAGPDDAFGIAVVHVRSWQAAYRGLLPQDFLDDLDPVRRAEGWRQMLADGAADGGTGTGGTVLVADGDHGVAGFAHLTASRDPDADPETVGEVTAIYLLPEFWGTGIGRRLMAESLETLRAAGFREATLWVLDTNQRARRFYEAGGWRADGAVKRETVGGATRNEARYRRPLRPEHPPAQQHEP